MKNLIRAFTFFFLSGVNGLYAQCALIEVPLIDRVRAATLIVEGRVIAKNSFWDNKHEKIYTSNRIEIFKIFKGNSTSAFIEVVTVGGVLKNEMMSVSNLLTLNKEDAGIFMLRPSSEFANIFVENSFEPVASLQGFIKYNPVTLDASDAFNLYNVENELYEKLSIKGDYALVKAFNLSEIKENSGNNTLSVPVISEINPQKITAGTKSLLTIKGSGFGNTRGNGNVGFRNADDGGASTIFPLSHQYIKWQNNEIVVEVPENAGTGKVVIEKEISAESADTLVISFSRINVTSDEVAYLQYMVGKSSTGGYIWQMSDLFGLNQLASAGFKRAFNTWRCNTGINWFIGDVTDIGVATKDGVNIIRFDIGEELPEGVLGVTYGYYSSCQDEIWYLNEIDMVFDNEINWQYGPELPRIIQYDFESVALHELGHAHQLGHVLDPNDIMHYSYIRGTFNRVLNAENLAGGNLIMQESTQRSVCEFSPMEAISESICGIPELTNFTFQGLQFFPNPVSTQFSIQYKIAEVSSVNIELFNSLGQKIHTVVNEKQPVGIYNRSLNIEELNISKGIYFLRLYLNDEKFTYKLIRM